MRCGLLFVFGVFISLVSIAQEKQFNGQQIPVFKHKADSIAYAQFEKNLWEVAGSSKSVSIDSIMMERQKFLEGKKYTMRMIVRQNREFTPYQSLRQIANKDSITKVSILGINQRKLPDGLSAYKNLESLELIGFKLRKL